MHSMTWTTFAQGRWPFRDFPMVNEICDRTADRLEQSGLKSLVPFFAAATARYSRWTIDLPASERHHHSFPFGLLIHSVETVERAITVGLETLKSFPSIWSQVTVALALLHDCGRLLDVVITDPETREPWDPLRGSLHLLREVRFLPLTGEPVRWRRGRGIRAHEYQSLDLFPVLLPPDSVAELKDPLQNAWWKYLGRHWMGYVEDFYPHAVAQIVAWADRRSAQADRLLKTAQIDTPRGTRDAPVSYYSPPPKMRTLGPVGFRRRGHR